VTMFDDVVDEYDAGRAAYPAALYDVLEPLEGLVVLEGGAGTGIATRALAARGAHLVPFDIGAAVLQRAVLRAPGLPAVVADGAAMPFKDACADMLCFAQSWHWVDERRRCAEAARVLRPGGRWAGWWSHARADGESWFDTYWTIVEAACDAHRDQRDIDWGDGLETSGLFVVGPRVTVPWVRRTSVDVWLTDERSRSYIAALPHHVRERVLRALEAVLRQRFPDGGMDVRYETWLWTAHPKQVDATAGRSP
jgi:SAM-dependent methyltransferase